MPAFAKLGDRLPSPGERRAASQLRRVLASQAAHGGDQTLKVTGEAGGSAEIVLTPDLSRLLMELLRHVDEGNAVTLVPMGRMLTTQEAADILDVSRPFLTSLLDKGEIGHVVAGRRRRIKAEDLLAYKERRDARRADALSALAGWDADLI